jgi:hypothetical protein
MDSFFATTTKLSRLIDEQTNGSGVGTQRVVVLGTNKEDQQPAIRFISKY